MVDSQRQRETSGEKEFNFLRRGLSNRDNIKSPIQFIGELQH